MSQKFVLLMILVDSWLNSFANISSLYGKFSDSIITCPLYFPDKVSNLTQIVMIVSLRKVLHIFDFAVIKHANFKFIHDTSPIVFSFQHFVEPLINFLSTSHASDIYHQTT